MLSQWCCHHRQSRRTAAQARGHGLWSVGIQPYRIYIPKFPYMYGRDPATILPFFLKKLLTFLLRPASKVTEKRKQFEKSWQRTDGSWSFWVQADGKSLWSGGGAILVCRFLLVSNNNDKALYCFFSVCFKALNESIADVKTNCVECFESVALCEQLHRADNDPAIRTLLQQRPLDPFLDSLLKSIRSQQAYVDREMTKADAVLDDQWQEYQSQRLNKRYLL